MSKKIRNVMVAVGVGSAVGAWGCSGELPGSASLAVTLAV